MWRLNERQRKCAIFRYFLEKTDDFPLHDRDPVPRLSLSKRQFVIWEENGAASPNALKKGSKTADRIDPKIAEMFRDDFGVMAFGQELGLTRAECQKAIDQLAGRLSPTFPRFSVTRDRSKRLIDVFQGLYVVYRREQTEYQRSVTGRDESIMAMSMSVRFALPGHKRLSEDLFRIRCKLTIPSYRLNFDEYEYDGYVSDHDGAGLYYWMFEDRKEIESDLVFLMTKALRRGPNGIFTTGTMVSRNQEEASRPAMWPIVIVKIEDLPPIETPDEDFDNSRERRFTDAHAGLYDPADIEDWICDELQAAEDFAVIATASPKKVGDS